MAMPSRRGTTSGARLSRLGATSQTPRRTALEAILALGLALCASAMPAAGQQRHVLWVSGGVGPGWVGASCEGCNDADRLRAFSGFIRIGTNVSPSTLVGLELNGWTRTPLTTEGVPAEGAHERLLSGSLVMAVYPLRSRRLLFAKAGLGVADYKSSRAIGAAKSTGLAPSIGLGVDIAVAPHLHVTPVFQYLKVISGGTIRINGESIGVHFHPDLIQLGIGLTYR